MLERDDPLLIIPQTCSISVLLLLSVRVEAELDSTLGVVTLTKEMGYRYFWCERVLLLIIYPIPFH